MAFDTWVWDSVRQAYYWTKATVYVATGVHFTTAGLKADLCHEIGHLYGIDDQYTVGGCASSPNSIMQGAHLDGQGRVDCQTYCPPPNYTPICIYAPTSWDTGRVNTYWGQGEAKNLSAVPNGSQVIITWDDYSWAENAYQLYFYKWNGSSWQYLTMVAVSSNTGSHDTVINRTISYVWTGSGPGNYYVVVKPYFIKYGQYGTSQVKTFTLSQKQRWGWGVRDCRDPSGFFDFP